MKTQNTILTIAAILTMGLTACGPQGMPGADGSDGKNGTNGTNGVNGINGHNALIKTLEATQVLCPNSSPNGSNYGIVVYSGTDLNNNNTLDSSEITSTVLVCNGSQGAQGTKGNTGATGSAGTNGTNGVNATPVTFVQFCKGFTPSYPNVFPESGLCVNNIMYGVYSLNGGFMAELPNGTYSSNGINASCTFTISNGCTVK